MERATGIEPVLPAWESKFLLLYFQYLQNRPIKICVHAAHTVHALPDLRIAGGRFGGRSLRRFHVLRTRYTAIVETESPTSRRADFATAKSRKLPIGLG